MSSESPVKFTILDASGSNWHTWQTTAKFELKLHKVWKYFDPTSPASAVPEKYSVEDQAKINTGTDPSTFKVLAAYTTWEEECDVAIDCLTYLVDPIHADIMVSSSIPRECWDALVVRFANQSTQKVTLAQTKLAGLKFPDNGTTSLTDFFATFSGLYQALATTWERLKIIHAGEDTFVAKRATTTGTSGGSSHECLVCRAHGHYARSCPTLSPQERARQLEKSRKRKEARAQGIYKFKRASTNLVAQVAQLQAQIAALDTRSSSDEASSGYDASEHTKTGPGILTEYTGPRCTGPG
ncbi:hypothetical protein RSOL_404970, partial [Rhizoctonia solani AG-3 Rhs1AP]